MFMTKHTNFSTVAFSKEQYFSSVEGGVWWALASLRQFETSYLIFLAQTIRSSMESTDASVRALKMQIVTYILFI